MAPCGSPKLDRQLSGQNATASKQPPLVASSFKDVGDLRNLPWSSIDNDTSRDLDQIEVAERLASGDVKVMVGIADADRFVAKASPIDDHAAKETTTVYTGVPQLSDVAGGAFDRLTRLLPPRPRQPNKAAATRTNENKAAGNESRGSLPKN